MLLLNNFRMLGHSTAIICIAFSSYLCTLMVGFAAAKVLKRVTGRFSHHFTAFRTTLLCFAPISSHVPLPLAFISLSSVKAHPANLFFLTVPTLWIPKRLESKWHSSYKIVTVNTVRVTFERHPGTQVIFHFLPTEMENRISCSYVPHPVR